MTPVRLEAHPNTAADPHIRRCRGFPCRDDAVDGRCCLQTHAGARDAVVVRARAVDRAVDAATGMPLAGGTGKAMVFRPEPLTADACP